VSDPARRDLDARALEWMRETDWRDDEARFESLALDLFQFQFERCEPYRRFCEARGRTPSTVVAWQEVPAVPAGAFKEVELRSFPKELERATFRTSGTSQVRRGELHLDTLELYEASLLPPIRRLLFPDLEEGERAELIVLAPSPAELPDSSLSHMFGCMLDAIGTDESRFAGDLSLRDLEDAERPLTLCGTAFAFVHLLDGAGRARLPDGSRILETGGFKGRSREVSRDALYDAIEAKLGVPRGRIVNQYGMTELGSQFYDSVLREPERPRRKLGPPWARVRIVDPVSGLDAPPASSGVIRIHDLANTGSVAAIETADLGRRIEDGFEVLGREPGAEERGCSIAADLMLGAR
jgi:hypothetical protein